jgi:O-methyltransferase domain
MTTGAVISSGRPPYMRLAELLIGARIALTLRVVAERGIADMLGDGAKSAEELSSQAGIPAPSLRRLLRALSYVGVFQEDNDGRFTNSDVSAYLCSGSDPSLREMSLILNDDAMLRGWQHLEQVLETGNPAFAAVNGKTFFEHIASDPKRSETMARFMKGIYGPEGPRIAAGFPFGRFKRLIDVGGGAGHILADILYAHPEVEGAVFDLPRTAEVARRFLGEQGLGHRSEVFAGDFLEAVTPGYDAYFIKSTLHDWDDDKSVQILTNCQNAMLAHGRVLVTEIVLEPGKPIGHPHRFIDMEMMVSFGGKERTADEFGTLMHRAGLRLEQVHPIEESFFSVLEGSKA